MEPELAEPGQTVSANSSRYPTLSLARRRPTAAGIPRCRPGAMPLSPKLILRTIGRFRPIGPAVARGPRPITEEQTAHIAQFPPSDGHPRRRDEHLSRV